ncbi:plasmid pRiA4b ORF-3 family protein [Bradyrhizobium japonicum]|uniref:plasmid pRiA4b ORF-3 family protein n=1 Tax=Bradyrhizobium japonicum TaxID=375 RepID=UPI001FD88964|nr:plasmid pRiA4b ORF-3 family protein [Bradyrhizobium japonicum]
MTLQAAFGWTNSHLFEFLGGEGRWGIPDPDGDFGPQPIDARKTRLSNIVQETGAKTIHYLYDFGYSWDHVIKLEKWFDNTTTEGLPLLLEAAGRCPPEDVGGASGYAEYLDAIRDPTHPEHEQMRLWGPSSLIPTSSTGRRSRPPSTHCRKYGSRAGAPRVQNRRQAPIKWASDLRLRSTKRTIRYIERHAKDCSPGTGKATAGRCAPFSVTSSTGAERAPVCGLRSIDAAMEAPNSADLSACCSDGRLSTVATLRR